MTTATGKNGRTPHATPNSRTGAHMPPHDEFAERALIGSILIGGWETFDEVFPVVVADDFYLAVHADLFRAMSALREANQPIDGVAVADAASPSIVGGVAKAADVLTDAMDSVPHRASAGYYAGIVATAARRRRAIAAAHDLAIQAHDQASDLDEAIATTEGTLHQIIERKVFGKAVAANEMMHALTSRIGKERKPGLSTGFCDLDALLGGLYPGQLVILAARPSVGKTALAGNVCLSVADTGNAVLMVSLEQSWHELSERFVCSLARIDSDALNSTKLSEATLDSIDTAANRIARMPILVDDTTPRTVSQIAALTRLHRRRDKISLLVVDYLQLISPEDRRTPREQQVAEIARGLKLLARGLEMPVIALAQLNRAVEVRANKRPMLSDLRESGAIEQDADVVMFLDRPSVYDSQADPSAAYLYVAKHRSGRTGDVTLNWHAASMTFRNASNHVAGGGF